MKTLPQCPSCDAVDTLSIERIDPHGVKVCTCSCCAKRCYVAAGGAIVHVESRVDISGVTMTDP